jgi:hypothetical protein
MLLVEEEGPDEIVEVDLADVFPECSKRGARISRGCINSVSRGQRNLQRVIPYLSFVQGRPH